MLAYVQAAHYGDLYFAMHKEQMYTCEALKLSASTIGVLSGIIKLYQVQQLGIVVDFLQH